MKALLLAVVLLAPPVLAAADKATPAPAAAVPLVRHVDAKAAEKLLAEDKAKQIVVLDVRTKEEYDAGHLEGAVNLDFNSPDFEAEAKRKLDPKKTYLVHCAVGGRSRRSLPKLQAAGITNLVHLDGGYTAWTAAGCAVKPPAK